MDLLRLREKAKVFRMTQFEEERAKAVQVKLEKRRLELDLIATQIEDKRQVEERLRAEQEQMRRAEKVEQERRNRIERSMADELKRRLMELLGERA